jgi:GTP-binding protein
MGDSRPPFPEVSPMEPRFVDRVVIKVIAGKGGNGIVAFRREPYVPRGGPSGGSGGSGGSVSLVVNEKLSTLADFPNGACFRAGNGSSGGRNNRTGGRGENIELRIPPGTSVFDNDSGLMLGDMTEPGATLLVVRGGRPGKGNATFATPSRQAPRIATKGEAGEEREIRMELALIADVGLVGLPNAGKSTLLSRISAARPKVGDYPFTTLHPSLGVVSMGRGFSFVVADLPGLIEGAHQGHGLGHQFLRHVERTRILVYIVAADLQDSPSRQFQIVRDEVLSYNPGLGSLEEIIVLSKIDLLDDQDTAEIVRSLQGTVFPLSAVTGRGVKPFLNHLAERVANIEAKS